ncbi:PMM [Symbiodinium natans]|uniref:Phosphomannomutase n=1 Tax=Symbiodinium natans TaxID=878477 RepID=A0A812MRE8_9DINO|nr:PMM [Symbiodinium natans]
MAAGYAAGAPGKNKRILALFDVDGTLTEPRKVVSPETVSYLQSLREKICIGVVGGSDLAKQKEQLGDSPNQFDFCFSENGLLAYKDGAKIGETSIVQHLGEEKLKKLVNWVLKYFSELDIPVKRGTFVEFRQGMLNLSPIGRNCSREERNEFEKFDLANNIRKTMVAKMKEEFADYNMTYSIGGQISFDVFPTGWDKTYCLRYLPEADFDEIHFFGDKTFEGGNDFEIYTHPRTKGHSIDDANPLTTLKKLEELFGVPAPKALTPPSSH